MSDMPILPRIMVAPNGARRTKADHPRLPISAEEIATTAAACFAAGAGGIRPARPLNQALNSHPCRGNGEFGANTHALPGTLGPRIRY